MLKIRKEIQDLYNLCMENKDNPELLMCTNTSLIFKTIKLRYDPYFIECYVNNDSYFDRLDLYFCEERLLNKLYRKIIKHKNKIILEHNLKIISKICNDK